MKLFYARIEKGVNAVEAKRDSPVIQPQYAAPIVISNASLNNEQLVKHSLLKYYEENKSTLNAIEKYGQ